MKVKDLLDIQEVLEKRKIPCDLCDDELNQHYSQSKDEFINILDMDLIHLIRSYSKCLDMGKVSDQNLITQKLDTIIDTSYELRGIIKNE
jgi:hypothetical protein